jgi:hypothetical protein
MWHWCAILQLDIRATSSNYRYSWFLLITGLAKQV